jgi:hypothetical protein
MGKNDFAKVDGDCFFGSEANTGVYGRKGSVTSYGNVTSGTTATMIKDSNIDRVTILIYNNDSAQTIYLGANTVTISNGYELFAGKTVSIEDVDAIYGVGSGTADIRYIEVAK